MSIFRNPVRLATWMLVMALASSVQAQICTINPANPFIEPNEFAPDYQFFDRAAEIDCQAPPMGNTGWFGTYDRAYLNISRPETSLTDWKGDWTWGNRFTVGYMTPGNHGWLATFWHIDGPNVYDIIDVRELDAADTDVFPTNTIRLKPSRNFLTVNGVELNKTFRCGPLYHGGIWEPYLGVRFIEIRDFTEVETTLPGYPTGNLVSAGPITQPVVRDHYDTRNNLVGGQLGTRVLRQRGRWDLSADVRAFAFENFQWVTDRVETTWILYDAGLAETDRQTVFTERSENFDEFSFGMEIRAEAAYEITRDISVRVGFEMLHFFKGIARGADSLLPPSRHGENAEDLTAVGVTSGVTLNY